ncbi:hypothetical protein RND81_03G024400 [Saponaria officinalis]|uniref:Uncharacterized protein n=1 Tax=Saponaria officinalis TaxID=3572 RepID=A0AAW1LXW7_SAPOF
MEFWYPLSMGYFLSTVSFKPVFLFPKLKTSNISFLLPIPSTKRLKTKERNSSERSSSSLVFVFCFAVVLRLRSSSVFRCSFFRSAVFQFNSKLCKYFINYPKIEFANQLT